MRKILSILLLFFVFIAFSCSSDSGKDGAAGPAGADGTSITWLGSFDTAPASPNLNDAYYNTTDGTAYFWDGSTWQTLVQDGATGATGAAGSDGIAISWLGSSATAPASPNLNDAYYNTTDGTAYIWNGSTWQTLVQDGQDWSDVTSTVVENGDFTVTDYSRTLVWKKCSQGQSNDATCSGIAGTFQYCSANDNTCNGAADGGILYGAGTSQVWSTCEAETISGRLWRVPTKDELRDFYDNAYSNNTSLFPNTIANYYWSATSDGSNGAWYVGFNSGTVGTGSGVYKTSSYYVRCVSTGL